MPTMNMRTGLLFVVLTVIIVGCRRPDPTVDLLESEMRWLEDQLYLMEDEFARKQDELASCRRENRALRGANGAKPSGGGSGIGPADQGEEPFNLSPPSVEEGEEIEPPQVELPGPAASLPLDINLRPASMTEDVEEVGDPPVTHIVFNRHLTGGVDLDHRPGDDGLMLVVEPRNADGQYVPLPGPVSVVVLDPSKQGEDARVARWDYDSIETKCRMRKTLFGRGIYLEEPWPHDPPDSDRLHVYVRYTTPDGRKLQIDREIEVDTRGAIAGSWTPASKPSGDADPTRSILSEARPGGSADGESGEGVKSVAPEPDDILPRSTGRHRRAQRSRPEWRPYR